MAANGELGTLRMFCAWLKALPDARANCRRRDLRNPAYRISRAAFPVRTPSSGLDIWVTPGQWTEAARISYTVTAPSAQQRTSTADEPGLEKEKPTLESSAADGIVAIVAASDTTAHTLSSLIWFLLSNPEYYQRVQLELDGVFVDGDDPLDVSKHQQLVLLSACINETLRLPPALPSIGTRHVHLNSAGGRTIAGRFIPEGTNIYTPPYSLHRNPDYFFPYPHQFVPDRWLPGANFEKHETSAFIPFSSGPANCVGQKLAKRELLMVISLLLKSFHLRFAEGFDSEAWPTHIHDFFVATRATCEEDERDMSSGWNYCC
ncbi:cytochrome P450 [Mycena galericulata]|nr:cytochrome P450 [Mycena galericulata]